MRRPTASAKAVIFLHQWGGPGQHETFDPKPDAPDNVRGWYGATKTKLPGVIFGERIPKLAAMADRFTVVRCLQHTMKNHNSAGYYSLTGYAPPTDDQRLRDSRDLFPAYGSVVERLAPARPSVPTFVAFPHVLRDGSVTPGQHASFLGKACDPLLVTLTLWGVRPGAVPAAVGRMALDRGHIRRAPGLQFAKLLGTGNGRTFTVRDADPLHWGLLAVWSDPSAARAFEASPTHRAWGRIARERLDLALRPVASRGLSFVCSIARD